MLNTLKFIWSHPLNAYGRWAALGRFARWQAASRLLAGPIALPFVEETRLFASKGMTGATGNWYCGLHEYAEMAFVLHFLRDSDLFVDVGANVGSYTVLAGGGVKAMVVAIEPVPSTFLHLQRNVVLNGLEDQVELHCAGVSECAGEMQFTSQLDTVNHVLADDEQGPSIRVPVVPLDGVLAGRAPALIKIDVEGHELAVLVGAQATLADNRLKAVLMETNGSGARYGIDDAQLLGGMAAHGFKPFGYDPVSHRLQPWNASLGNTVFVRDAAFVEARTASSRKYRLVNGEI